MQAEFEEDDGEEEGEKKNERVVMKANPKTVERKVRMLEDQMSLCAHMRE